MGFEIVMPRCHGPRSVEKGNANLNKAGQLKLSYADLLDHKICPAIGEGDVTLLVDRATNRIALRKAVAGEPYATVKVNKQKTAGTVSVKSCLAQLGRDPAKSAGRYALEVKDNLLIIQVAPPRAK